LAETILYGAYSGQFDVAGKTVEDAYKRIAHMWNVPRTAVCYLNGGVATRTHLILPGATLEFRQRPISRSRTVCSECDEPTFTEIDGYPLCHAHYLHTVTHCTEHVWLLDSTEVFQEKGKPIILAFYFCTICHRAVIARAHESADQAWVNRQRERLLRIEKLLTEDV
jgi:hypothetical protein